jgi:ankyrin repeat protein
VISPAGKADGAIGSELISSNKGVWDSWWDEKIRRNQDLLRFAKAGSYEEVAKSIDTNYNDDQTIASVHYQEPLTGFTSLHYAVLNRNLAMVNLLLANNIDVMLQDAKGQTAMHLSCINGSLPCYSALAMHNY